MFSGGIEMEHWQGNNWLLYYLNYCFRKVKVRLILTNAAQRLTYANSHFESFEFPYINKNERYKP